MNSDEIAYIRSRLKSAGPVWLRTHLKLALERIEHLERERADVARRKGESL